MSINISIENLFLDFVGPIKHTKAVKTNYHTALKALVYYKTDDMQIISIHSFNVMLKQYTSAKQRVSKQF